MATNGIIRRDTFFGSLPKTFDRMRSGKGREGCEAILDVWDREFSCAELTWLAYILATAWHETWHTMEPVREGSSPRFRTTDEGAIRHVRRLFANGRIRQDYSVPDPVTQKSYYGRGFVQLTWADNYKKMSEVVGVNLYAEPDLAMEQSHAARILCIGMRRGMFRKGHSLERYLGYGHYDWINARLIVNGRRGDGTIDQADTVADIATRLYPLLSKAWAVAAPNAERAEFQVASAEVQLSSSSDATAAPADTVVPSTVSSPSPQRPKLRAPGKPPKPLHRSRTLLGAATASLAAIAGAIQEFFEPESDPSIFLLCALAVVLAGALLVAYARVDDRRKMIR